jgi:hypothetical protein
MTSMDADAIRINIEGEVRRADPATAEDSVWRRLTALGNHACETEYYACARRFYDEALVEAERLFDRAAAGPVSVPVAVIYNVSCHNLADLMERSGDARGAEAFLQQAFEKLMLCARSPKAPLPLRLACARNLKPALAVFVAALARRQAPELQIAEVVERAKATALAVFHAAEHVELASKSDSNRPSFSS